MTTQLTSIYAKLSLCILDPVILQYYCEESLGRSAIERKECKSILSKY